MPSRFSFSVSAFQVSAFPPCCPSQTQLRPLLEPPPQPPKPEIGFHVKEHAVRYQVRKRQRAWIERLPEPRTTSFRTWPGSLANSDSGNWSRQSRTGQRLLELSAGNENSVDNAGMIIA
jgi:hypothetical protein